jgi:uncharacterized surface protein with fasciclin (FAS1) repeats
MTFRVSMTCLWLQPENKAQLVDILTYHVAAGNVSSGDLRNNELIPTVEGKKVSVSLEGQAVYLNVGTSVALVIKANVEASNGVVHIINAVLLPPAAPSTLNIVQLAQATPDLSTLVTAVVAADLATTLSGSGPFTVLAPTNEAFAALPAGVLNNLLKVRSGRDVPALRLFTAVCVCVCVPVRACLSRRLLRVRACACDCLPLRSHLLPVPPLIIASLSLMSLQPQNKALLQDYLLYHVVAGASVYSYQLTDGQTVAAANKETLKVGIRGGEIKFNAAATVIAANIGASNGVVHLIDRVLVPPSWALPTAAAQ